MEDISAKKKKLDELNESKTARILKLESEVALLQSEKQGKLSKEELCVLEENLRAIFSSIIV